MRDKRYFVLFVNKHSTATKRSSVRTWSINRSVLHCDISHCLAEVAEMARKTTNKKSAATRKSVRKPLNIIKTIKKQPNNKSSQKPKSKVSQSKTPKKSQKSNSGSSKKKQPAAAPKTQKPESKPSIANSAKPTKTGKTSKLDSKAPMSQAATKTQRQKSKPSSVNSAKPTKTGKTSKVDPKSSLSQSVFGKNEVISVYQELEYKPESDVTKNSSDTLTKAMNDIAINKAERSPDLFETESNDAECIVPVQSVSIGIQCTIETETRDAQVNTDNVVIDKSVQTSPMPRSFNTHEWNEDDLDDFDDLVESSDSYSYDESGSSSNLDDFDMLESLKENQNSSKPPPEQRNHVEQSCVEDTLTIVGSPPRNQIFKNQRFHSPDSLQTQE